MFKASDQEAAKSAASLTKASQALVPLDVSQGSHGLDRPVSVSSKNIFEDKVSTPQTELPAVIKNAFRHSPQPKCYRINLSGSHILSPEDFKETDLKDVNPGKRPVLQLELSPAVKQRGGVKMALQRPAMEVHIDNMAPKSVGDADGTEMRAKASISILKSPSGTGKNAGVEWKDLELLPERIVEQDIEIFYTCPDESRNIDTTFAENTHCSPASTDVTATAKASIHFVGGIVAPENQVFHQAHVLRGRKGQCCSSTSPDKTCQPHITTLIPSHETESGFEPVTAIKLPRGRSHHSIASPPDRDILELGTQQCTNGQKSVNDTAKHKQRPKRQRKYIVRASGSPVRTEDVAVEAERSVGEAQLLQVNPTVLRFPSPGPEIRLTYPSMLSQSISSYAPAKSTVEAMMQASNLTDTDDPFISTPDKEISILRRNLDEFTKVDQQSDDVDAANTVPFTSSSTSYHSQTSSAPTLENYDDFMNQWEASLGPEQHAIFRIMLHAAQKVVSKLIDSEDMIDDLASSYGSSLEPIFRELVSVEQKIAEQKRRRSLKFLESYAGSIEKHITACRQIAQSNNLTYE